MYIAAHYLAWLLAADDDIGGGWAIDVALSPQCRPGAEAWLGDWDEYRRRRIIGKKYRREQVEKKEAQGVGRSMSTWDRSSIATRPQCLHRAAEPRSR